MINNFEQLLDEAKKISKREARPVKVVVAAGNDKAALEAIQDAKKMKLADGLLVGTKELILKTLDELNINRDEFEIIEADEETEICRRTVQAIHDGE
ncbi:MAG TPA: phosphate acyltransferase, partial [bacterium]